MVPIRTKILVTAAAGVAFAVTAPALAHGQNQRDTTKADSSKPARPNNAPSSGGFILQMGSQDGVIMRGQITSDGGLVIGGGGGAGNAGDNTPVRFQVRAADSAKAKKDTTKADSSKKAGQPNSGQAVMRAGIRIGGGGIIMGGGADSGGGDTGPARFQIRAKSDSAPADSAKTSGNKKPSR